jgi:hypothetical protein
MERFICIYRYIGDRCTIVGNEYDAWATTNMATICRQLASSTGDITQVQLEAKVLS